MKFVVTVSSIVVILVLLTGCSVTDAKVVGAAEVSSLFTLQVINPMVEPTLDVGEKISAKATGTTFLRFLCFGDYAYVPGIKWGDEPPLTLPSLRTPIAKSVRDYAAYKACEQTGADVLVAPRYEVKTTDYIIFCRYHATVTGYAGRYKEFKPVSMDQRNTWEMQKNVKRFDFGNTPPSTVEVRVVE